MIETIVALFVFTSPLWIFLAILCVALFIEEGIIARNKKRMVDNPTLW
jgi:hypothetical protein